ncbi:hypothetical protein EUGRSUZ_A02991 [Eucalyptus grandis]|uniref:Uncharacterized protein n=2 Tax=Eucalyptus grandis TaxID=71139 RepID=A0ACC3M9Q6_EUCGR|nr:hypothetical protein EUGRSUZ_A02991 [Eucalyptus grandis]
MQGPGDEAYSNSKKDSVANQVPSPDVKGFGGPSMSQKKVNITAESGTCNVCSAPCTSCMHLNQVIMGSKRKEYSDETCLDGVASQYSANDYDVLRPLSGASAHSPQGTADETSRPQGFNSGYSCDNTKNKPASTDASGALDEDLTVRKLSDREKLSETYLPPKPWSSSVEINISTEDSKPVEGQDDNISCVSSGNDLNSRANNDDSYIDRKVAPSSSVSSGNLYPEGMRVSIQEDGSERDDQEIPLGDFKSLNEDNQVEKLTESLETPDVPDPSPQVLPEDESEGSDILEQDVKVCDICGDAGREDLLAICSRCSDGAEHTYCMREMLQKVPEGDWVCEECKSADENENQKPGIEGKTLSRVTSASQVPDKSFVENIEVSPTVIGPGSSKLCGSTRRVTSSRDSCFKNIDKGKAKLARQMSCVNSVQDFPEGARSPQPSNLRSKGTLLKSNSFNAFIAKPKVKVIDEGMIQKHKSIRENSSFISKEGPTKIIGKSMSFKHANPGRPLAVDAKVKMLPTKLTHVQTPKGSKNLKEGSVLDRMSLRKLDRTFSSLTRDNSTPSTPNSDQKLTSCGEPLQGSPLSNNRDSKLAQSDVKPAVLVKSAEYKSNQLDQKEEPLTSSSRTVEKHCIEGNGLRHDGLSRSKGLANHTDKARDCSVSRSKPAVISGSRSIFCQKCKEVGHDAESCPVSSLQVGTDVSMTRSMKEETYNSSKTKTPITSSMLKKPGRRNKGPEKSEDLSVSSPTHMDPLSFPDVSRKVMSADGPYEGQAVRQSCTSDSRLQMIGNNATQLTGPQKGATSLKGANIDFTRHPEGSSSSHLPCVSVLPSAICRISAIPEHECIWRGSLEVCRGSQQLDFCGGLQAHLSTLASTRVLDMVKKFSDKLSLSEVPRSCTWPTQFYDSGAQDDNIALYFFAEDPESYERSYKGLLEKMIKSDLALKGNFDGVELLIFPSNQLPEKSQRWNTLFYLWGVFRGRNVIGSEQQSGSSLKSSISTSNVTLPEKDIPPSVVPSSNKLSLPKCNGENLPPCGKYCEQSSPSGNPSLGSSQITPSSMAMNGNCHAKDSSIDKMRICLNEVSIEEDSGHDSIDLHGSFTSSDWSKQQKKCPQTSQNEVSGSDAIVPMELQPYVTTGAHSSAEDDKMLMQCATSPDRKVSLSHSLLGGIRNSREQELHGMGNEVKLDRILKEEDRLMDRGAAVDVESTTFDVLKHLQHEQKQGAALEVESTTLDVLKHLQREKKRRHSDLVETALQTSFGTNEKVASKVSLSHSLLGGIRNSREQELHGTGNEVKLDRILKEEDRLMDRGAAVDVESTTFDVLKHLQHEQKQGAALEVESTTLDVLKHLQHEKKRRHSDLVETALQTSFGTNEKVAWNNVSSENVKIEHVDKKQKTDCREIYEASRPIDANLVDGFASQKSAQDSTLAVVEKLHNKVCDEPINLENTGTAERFFFPVLSNHAKDLTSAESSMPWKTLPSSVPARSHDGVPNLDLALGAKTKSSNKGLLPLWIGVADKSDSHPEAVAAQEEDPVSGSLSLSLSFPFPDSDKGFKPVPDAEQLLPESRRVNTSLLLFGDFSEK